MLHNAITHSNQFIYSFSPIEQILVIFPPHFLLGSLWICLNHVTYYQRNNLQINFFFNLDRLQYRIHVCLPWGNLRNTTIISLILLLKENPDLRTILHRNFQYRRSACFSLVYNNRTHEAGLQRIIQHKCNSYCYL